MGYYYTEREKAAMRERYHRTRAGWSPEDFERHRAKGRERRLNNLEAIRERDRIARKKSRAAAKAAMVS